MLIGDIPNRSKQERFQKTDIGMMVNMEYQKSRFAENSEAKTDYQKDKVELEDVFTIEDEDLLQLLKDIRRLGDFETYILPQSYELPFGYTREDILIVKY